MTFQELSRVLQPFGLDPFCVGKKFLIFNLVSKNLKVKYRKSALGALWTLLVPIAMALVYYFVFKVILKVQLPHYLAFIVTGIFIWNFVAMTLLEGMESIVGNWGLLSKVPIPTQIFPYVGALTNLVNLAISFPILIAVSLLSGVPLGPSLILIPFLFINLFLITYSLSLTFAIVFVYLRDLRHIMGIIIQLWFYATPVIYNESMIPPKYTWILYLNPYSALIISFHRILVDGKWPNPSEIITIAMWSFITFFFSLMIQKFLGQQLIEKI